jgi:hypothetical protein
MYNPNDPRQRNWHRQEPMGRDGGFEQEPRYGNPARDQRDRGMYGDQEQRQRRGEQEYYRDREQREYLAASDQGEADRFGGADSYGARSRPPQEQGQEGYRDWREGNWGNNRDEIQEAPRNYDRDYARGRPQGNRPNDYRAFGGDYRNRPAQARQYDPDYDVNDWSRRGGGDPSRGQSNFIRQDRGTWGALGPRPNFGPEASNPGFAPGAPKGAFAGRGPRGYRRSDERISEDVCQALTDDPDVDASNIEVKVQDGEVTLTGTVDSRRIKRHTEDLAESVTGVKEIHNQLRIARD